MDFRRKRKSVFCRAMGHRGSSEASAGFVSKLQELHRLLGVRRLCRLRGLLVLCGLHTVFAVFILCLLHRLFSLLLPVIGVRHSELGFLTKS